LSSTIFVLAYAVIYDVSLYQVDTGKHIFHFCK